MEGFSSKNRIWGLGANMSFLPDPLTFSKNGYSTEMNEPEEERCGLNGNSSLTHIRMLNMKLCKQAKTVGYYK